MRRPSPRRTLVTIISVAVTAVLLPLLQSAASGLIPAHLIEAHPVLVWVALGTVSAVALVLWNFESRATTRAEMSDEARLGRAMAELAKAVDNQWREEAARRRIGDGDLFLPLRWSVTRPGIDDAPERHELPDAEAVASAYRSVERDRMLVLGDAGSGKTALMVLLTRGLVRQWRRQNGDTQEPDAPVPVLFSLAAWNPARKGLRQWMGEQLADNYPFLRGQDLFGKAAPARLARETGRILPLLDGFDELKPAVRATALHEIERAGLPAFVIACRRPDYEKLVEDGGRTITGAAVATLEPFTPATLCPDFLSQGYAPERRALWAPVLQRVQQDPDGALATALSTPLMLSLARDVYRNPRARPDELLAPRFSTEESVKTHLLTALVPATFPELPHEERRSGWHGPDAERWLRFLAARLGRRPIRWWELPRLAGIPERILAVLVGTAIVSPPVGLGFGTLFGPIGAITAAAVSAVALAVANSGSLPPPSELHFGSPLNLWAPLCSGLVAAVFVTLTVGMYDEYSTGLVAGVGMALPVGMVYSLAKPDATVQAVKPRQLLQWDRQVALVFGCLYAVTTGVVTAIVVNPGYGLLFGFCCGLSGAFLYGPVWLFAFQVNKVGLIAWLHFLLARLILAPRGLLPWRTLEFLEEAHKRGVLRQVGPVYEFRHSRLREALAGRTPS